ncbi:MAG: hypothetical protein AAFU33_00325 [Bacteroidota bacterium]
MKRWMLLFVWALSGVSGCQSSLTLPEGLPSCMRTRMGQILAEDPWEPTARIYEVTYQHQQAFFIPSHCCDIPSELYMPDCQLLCFPDGGLHGQGDGKCMDFEFQPDQAKLIWQDNRKSFLSP